MIEQSTLIDGIKKSLLYDSRLYSRSEVNTKPYPILSKPGFYAWFFKEITKKEIIAALICNRQSKCLCGSEEKLRNCHPLIFKAISRMKIELA